MKNLLFVIVLVVLLVFSSCTRSDLMSSATDSKTEVSSLVDGEISSFENGSELPQGDPLTENEKQLLKDMFKLEMDIQAIKGARFTEEISENIVIPDDDGDSEAGYYELLADELVLNGKSYPIRSAEDIKNALLDNITEESYFLREFDKLCFGDKPLYMDHKGKVLIYVGGAIGDTYSGSGDIRYDEARITKRSDTLLEFWIPDVNYGEYYYYGLTLQRDGGDSEWKVGGKGLVQWE